MKVKYSLLFGLLLSTASIFGQTLKRKTSFDQTEKCLYDFLVRNNAITDPHVQNDSFYILKKDSFFLFQSVQKNNEVLQIHAVRRIKNKTQTCGNNDWIILKKDYFNQNNLRLNPVFSYKKYFDGFDIFSSDYAAVQKNGKWGFINEYGKLIVPISFDEIKLHAFGIRLKTMNQVKIFSLEKNKESAFYDEISLTSPRLEQHDTRLTAVKKNGKMGMLNANLELVVPLIYDNITILGQRFLVGNRINKLVLINALDGKEISKLYDKMRLAKDPLFLETALQQDGNIVLGKIDINGKIIE